MRRGGAAVGVLLIAAYGCGPRVLYVERSPQAYYQTAFPTHDTARDLERAFRSLHRVIYTAEYHTYLFDAEAGVTEGDLEEPASLDRASAPVSEVHSKAGTAVVIARTERHAALITNDHVVGFPPVLIRYFDEDAIRYPRTARRVASVSMVQREWGHVADQPHLGEIRVLARDPADDVAVFEVLLPDQEARDSFQPLRAAPGDSRRLSLGSFVYVLGYPGGYPMVTRAIVSDPDRDGRGGFLTDGMWNEGISGGALLAIRGDDGSLEWVGITRAGAGMRELRLRPADPEAPEDLYGLLYQGPIYADAELRVQYGITFSVSMFVLRDFVNANREMLRARGYDLRRF
jgi:S1-C subfamily serine protease